jgi:hypothetical protein
VHGDDPPRRADRLVEARARCRDQLVADEQVDDGAATSGLPALLLGRHEGLPQPGLRAMVPVNTRPTGSNAELSNKISSMFVELPVAEADPRRRYERVRAASERPRRAAGARCR